MRRGQWDEAKRLLVAQGEVPDELKPKLGPSSTPSLIREAAGDRCETACRRSQGCAQVDLIQPYLQLGQTDVVYQIIDESLDAIAWPGSTRGAA